jgi:hypothetical protein
MRLYFNGCSHTYGDDLRDKNCAWPVLVAKTLACDFVNDSVPGGSNQRIMYRTIKNMHQFDKIYVVWTYTSRFTRWRADNNHEINFNIHFKHGMYGDTKEYQEYSRLHYRYWHNELYAFKLWLQDILLLQNFLKHHNKPYVMINADNNLIDRWTVDRKSFNNTVKSLLCFDIMDDIQLLTEHEEIQRLVQSIDKTHFISWNQWWITKLHEQYPVGPTGHLLEDGHHAIAKYIIDHDTN